MELYLFRHAEYRQLYNCSLYSIDQVPLKERQHIFLGIIFIIFTIFSMTFYIPCYIEDVGKAFFQALVIACVNAVCSGVYNYMQVFPVSETVVLVASFSWVMCHGTPPILFITVNKTLRQDCIQIIKSMLKKKKQTNIVTIVLSTNGHKTQTI
uniref:G-protein coupled receptors family 1 profile domain-containing protein n=1 Tax=Ditylenchus dipsaci TaxID=166011 RepID=A0A915CRP4_9BILA